MKPIIKELMLKPVKEYFLMTVGMIMYSFAWIGCILPAKGGGGGAPGGAPCRIRAMPSRSGSASRFRSVRWYSSSTEYCC